MRTSILPTLLFLAACFISTPRSIPANPLRLWEPGKYRAQGRVEVTGRPGRDYYVEDGPWTYWYKNGRKEKEGSFIRGVKTGPWIYWYDDGTRMKEGSFDDQGREEGLWKYWYPTGRPRMEGTFQAGLPDGPWTFWFDQTGPALKMEGNFRGGKEEGFWSYRYADGRKEKEGSYREGLKDGAWTSWYPEGLRKSSGNFRGGLEEGEWIFREKCAEDGEEKIREWRYHFQEAIPYPGEREVEDFSRALIGHWFTEKSINTMDKAHRLPLDPNHFFIRADGEAVEMKDGLLLVADWVIEEEDPVERTVKVRFTLDNGRGAVIFGRFTQNYRELAGRYYLVDFLRGSRGKLVSPFRLIYAGTETGPDAMGSDLDNVLPDSE